MTIVLRRIRRAYGCSPGEYRCVIFSLSFLTPQTFRSHLPMLFMGMEQIILANHAQAEEAFEAARMICDEDPLLYNERGVMAYMRAERVSGLIAGGVADALGTATPPRPTYSTMLSAWRRALRAQ